MDHETSCMSTYNYTGILKILSGTHILYLNKDTWTSHGQTLVDVNENNVYN